MSLIRVVLTNRQVEALIAALDQFNPTECSDHDEGAHGDGSDCTGWSPRLVDALDEARDLLYEAIP